MAPGLPPDTRFTELVVAMRFFNRSGERGVVKDGKAWEADTATVLDEDLDLVGPRDTCLATNRAASPGVETDGNRYKNR